MNFATSYLIVYHFVKSIVKGVIFINIFFSFLLYSCL